MSGSVYNIQRIDDYVIVMDKEAAGYIGAAVVAVFKVVSPYLVAAAKGALVGSVVSAGVGYASGLRGGDLWQAALRGAAMGGIGAGLGGAIGGLGGATGSAASAAGSASTSAASGITAATSAATVGTGIGTFTAGGMSAGAGGAGAAGAAAGGAGAAGAAAGGVSGSIMNGIRSMFGNVDMQSLRRIGASIVNAAVNGNSMGRLDGLVEQQRAELEALRQSDLAAYNQRIAAAQSILTDADRMDPTWYARIRMADVAGMEANEFRQAMRNIAVRQGGSLDEGQRKSYQRGHALHAARSKALAWGRGFVEAEGAQNQLRAQGAALLGPNEAGFRTWQADTELLAARERARREASHSTWGGVIAGLSEQDYNPATRPDPSADEEEDDGGFGGGIRNPFGGG